MFEETPLHVFLKTLPPPKKKGVPFGGGGEGGRARPGKDGKFLTPGCARNGPRGAGGSGEPAPQAGHAPRWGPGRGPDVSNFLPPLGASSFNGKPARFLPGCEKLCIPRQSFGSVRQAARGLFRHSGQKRRGRQRRTGFGETVPRLCSRLDFASGRANWRRGGVKHIIRLGIADAQRRPRKTGRRAGGEAPGGDRQGREAPAKQLHRPDYERR